MDYKFHFDDEILFLEFNIPIIDKTVDNTIEEVKNTFPDHNFRVVAIKNILGYWSAKDLLSCESIYCGTRSLKSTKEQIKKVLNEIKSSSN